jgi:hypothetical protein
MSDEVFTNAFEGDAASSGFATVAGVRTRWTAGAVGPILAPTSSVEVGRHGYAVRHKKNRLTATFLGEPTTIMTPDGAVASVDASRLDVHIDEFGVTAYDRDSRD